VSLTSKQVFTGTVVGAFRIGALSVCPGGRVDGQITQKWPCGKFSGRGLLVAVRQPILVKNGRKVAVRLT